MKKNNKRKNFKEEITEIYIIVISGLIVLFLSAKFDLFERLVTFVSTHESYELDEIIPLFIFLVFALLIFSIRRTVKLTKINKEIRQLQGIIPICSVCKKIRDEEGLWQQLEMYISNHSEAEFSHGICADCAREIYGEDIVKKPTES